MVDFKKNIFSAKTKSKFSKLKYKSSTTLLHKPNKRKKKKRKKLPNLKNFSKKIFKSNANINRANPRSSKKMLAILIAFLLLISYILFFTGFTKIITIQVLEGEIDSENTQIRRIVEPLRNSNILFVDSESVEESLKKQIDNLAELEVKKKFPKTIVIKFAKFEKVANLTNYVGPQRIKKNFIINASGILMEKDVINQNLPFISLDTKKAFNLGDHVVSKDNLDYMLGTKSDFEERFNMKILEISFLSDAREVHLTTEKNFNIWLDIQIPFKDQLNKLKNSIPKIDIYNDNLDYIDLRIQSAQGQKIIFKYR
jgi:hypothetical protein